MKTKLLLSAAIFLFIISSFSSSAQFKYQNGRVLIGNAAPFGNYPIVVAGGGMYFNHSSNRFFQIDVMSYGSPRLAGHNDQITFYNTQTGTYNSIQVNAVYNLSDSKSKTNIKNLSEGLSIVKSLRPVSYNFVGNERRFAPNNKYTGENAEIGLIAQEVEELLPNLIYTDDKGNKLVNYISIIPILIDAIQSLNKELETLKQRYEK